MSQITMYPGQMRSKASELASLRLQHLDLMRKLRILVNNLSDIWQGEAQQAFVSGFNSRSQDLSELASTLEEYISVVNSAADKMEQVDQDLLSKVYKI